MSSYLEFVIQSLEIIVGILTNNSYIAHTDVLFKQMDLLGIDDIYKLKVMKFYYDLKHSLPLQLSCFVSNLSITSRNYGLKKIQLFYTKRGYRKQVFDTILSKLLMGR